MRNLTSIWFGTSGDWPVPGDYDGDGTGETAVFRPNQARWLARDVTAFYHGMCRFWPKPADFDGDGTADGAVFRNQAGHQWVIRDFTELYFGTTGDVPVTR